MNPKTASGVIAAAPQLHQEKTARKLQAMLGKTATAAANASGKLFPGQYFDEETGLHQNGFRTYDPATGRYLESDPIGLEGGLNTYGYVENNPLNDIDPLGLMGGGAGPFPGRGQGPFGPVCGSGSSATFIPDGPFKNACKKHDECYGTCGKTKEQCDLDLCTNGACLYGFLLDGALSGPSKKAYDKAQNESGCDDCNK